MSQVQSGILPEHCRAAIWIEANVKGDVNALREASKVFIDKLATFQTQFPDAQLGAVVAFGNNVWRAERRWVPKSLKISRYTARAWRRLPSMMS
jgi:putative iron-dependent peroxidase